MRPIKCVLCCVVVLLGSGCPGTLDDLAAYEGTAYSPAPVRDSGLAPAADASGEEADGTVRSWEQDAASLDAAPRDAGEQDALVSAPALDAGVSAAAEAGGAPSADAVVADASAGDGSADAAPAPVADAGHSAVDAGAGCDFRALISAKCGNAGCHGPLAVSSGLDLLSDNLAQRVAGKKGSMSCSNYLLIDTERPEQSALYLKVTPNACGSRMPLGGTLTDREQTCILQWITNL